MTPSHLRSHPAAECVLPAGATLGESPVWDTAREALWWVDITAGHLHRYTPADGSDMAVHLPEMLGSVALCADGRLLLALARSIAIYDPATLDLTPVPVSVDLPARVRFNDGVCDSAGRFWVGTMHPEIEPDQGALFCLEGARDLRRAAGPFTVSNGLAFSLDGGTLYHIDTPTQTIAAIDFDVKTGRLGRRRVAVEIPQEAGGPDGLAVDRDGMLWVALWGGRRVVRYDPRTGRALHDIPIPTAHVTSCAFGGPDLRDLYITTAREWLAPEALAAQPLAGGLFCVRTDTEGLAPVPFAGLDLRQERAVHPTTHPTPSA